jgi:hypothetical protein
VRNDTSRKKEDHDQQGQARTLRWIQEGNSKGSQKTGCDVRPRNPFQYPLHYS